MKRNRALIPLAAALLLAVPQMSFADHRGYGGYADHRGYGGYYGGGAPWWWVVPPLLYLSTLPAYGYPYPEPQPVIIQQPAPPTVVMQSPAPPSSQVVMPQVVQSWYYCAAPSGYYPYVTSCPSGWKLVPATPPGVMP